MYKFIDNQIKFEDFETPTGMTLHKENRWVKRAENIPWKETTCHRLAMSILLLNIRKIDKSFYIFFNNLRYLFKMFLNFHKLVCSVRIK